MPLYQSLSSYEADMSFWWVSQCIRKSHKMRFAPENASIPRVPKILSKNTVAGGGMGIYRRCCGPKLEDRESPDPIQSNPMCYTRTFYYTLTITVRASYCLIATPHASSCSHFSLCVSGTSWLKVVL